MSVIIALLAYVDVSIKFLSLFYVCNVIIYGQIKYFFVYCLGGKSLGGKSLSRKESALNKKYKIAVMGESNSGKTVFFGSYFHQATDLGRAKYPVAIKSQNSDQKITQIIKQLFVERKPVPGSDKRVDFSFSVDALEMDIELSDLPGGFTTNRDYWDDEDVRKDLQNADGVLFFISADDVINHPVEAMQINRVFADAISIIRTPQSGDVKGRADVPIWFIFTKGDVVPNVTVEELASRIPSLVDAATSQQVKGNWFARKIYRKGGYVRSYKTQAMGQWPDATTVPVDFEPVNVVEPLEELFTAMIETKSKHKSMFIKIVAALAILAVIAAESGSYYVDRKYFDSKKKSIEHLCETGNYSEALKIIDSYRPPFTSVIMPGFLRAGSELKTIREETYRQYEAALYAPIEAEISKINDTKLPEADNFFYETLKRVEEYVGNTHFAQVNPEHYAKVKSSAWFFEAVRLFNFDPTKQEVSPDEEFEIILKCLNYEAPENWRDRIQSRVDNILRHWGRTSPAEGSPDNLDPYIDRANQLINHPNLNLADEIKSYLADRVDFWKNEQLGRWQKLADIWVREANSLPYDERLESLSSRMAGKIPPEIRAVLITAHNETYGRLADEALQKYADDIDQLRSIVSKYPAMPLETKDKLTARIDFLYEKTLGEKIRSIRSARSVNELAKVCQGLAEEMKVNTVSQAISSSLQNLTDSRLNEIVGDVAQMAGNNNYAEAKQYLQSEISRLQQEIRSVIDDNRLISSVTSKAQELNASLMIANYQYCKSYFNSRKNTTSNRDVSACLNEMRKYLQTWPESLQAREGSEVKQAAAFLEEIQGGIPGRLIVVEGDFKAAKTFDMPDMKIAVYLGGSFQGETETIFDKVTPHFGAGFNVRWAVNMSTITFKGIEVDTVYDDEVFEATIYPGGMRGYEKLSQTLRNNDCTLTVRFEPSGNIPSCPW